MLQTAALWTSKSGQRRIPEEAGGEKAGDVWVWASGGSLQRLSAGCTGGSAASRTADVLSDEEMVNPKLCPP